MKKLCQNFLLFFLITILAVSCSPVKTNPEDILYVNLVWHQHQPLYYKNAEGVYTRPWVRVHATKDYYDMAAILKEYPDVRATFNLTPVLLHQLNDFIDNDARDLYWVMSEIPAANLSEENKRFILTRFFDANWDNIIARFPRYQELLNKRGGASEDEIDRAVVAFTEQDFRDLQIWFNLAWFDPMFLEDEPLAALVTRGRDFTEEDKQVVFGMVRQVLSDVIPLHKEMQDDGQIEVITTPYAHPILPLIYNTDIATVGNAAAEMPPRFSWPNDAIAHLERSVEIYNENFGKDPTGLWPGEGAVSEDIIPLVSQAGYAWMATGEPVLAMSLGIDNFTRDANETVQEADALYRPYYVQGRDGEQVAIFFRDWEISDKIGFEYSQTPAEEAAQNLIDRLENIRARLIEEGSDGPNIVSIILDGENAWEYYPNDGVAFLHAMYQKLSESETLKTVTPTDYLEMFPEQRTLETLFPGAWFSPNYDTWIGEDEEKQAWTYLGEVRNHLAKYDLLNTREASPEALAQALDYMYFAEGSDWFWWFGADQDSGQDAYFDEGFRALLKNVYISLGDEPPVFLDVPVIPRQPVTPTQNLRGISSPVVDGLIEAEEWSQAAFYEEDSLGGISVALDKENLYVRLDMMTPFSNAPGIYVSIPGSETTFPFARGTVESDNPLLLGINAAYLFEWNGSGFEIYTAGGDGWEPSGETADGAAGDGFIEMQIPLERLGELSAGDEIRLVSVLPVNVLPGGDLLPSEGPVQIILPDLGSGELVFEVQDPEGDDFGPGTYTYPTDPVFEPQVFDLKSFSVLYDEDFMIFKLAFYGPIPNPWGSGRNLSLQTVDVYVDLDPGGGTGLRMLLPGRNAALSSGNGWDVAIWAEGWEPAVLSADEETGQPRSVNVDFRILVDPALQTITIRVPRQVFGEGDPQDWGYAAVVLSQDGFPSTGVWRVRDVHTQAEQWRFGGAPDDNNHTRIIDMIWPAGASPDQTDMLGSYISSNAALQDLGPDDFPQIELLP
jgi:alpha-amylase/alpha-mannosidase (GH57 family)